MFTVYFASLAGMATLSVIVTAFLNKSFNIIGKTSKLIISWITPIILCIAGLLFGLGLFADYGTIEQPMAWVETILTGIGLGLSANGIYEIEVIRKMIDFIKNLKINKSK